MTERERPLRLVFFSASLIADIDNPAATSTRALLGALTAAGHEVTHLERRGNALLIRQLRERGSAALRSLNARYPKVRARQYDLPTGQQRTVWFGTEVSTADAVVALPGTPDEVLALIAPFETPHLVRVVPTGAVGDLNWPNDGRLVCVEPRARSEHVVETLAVAYDNIDLAAARNVPDAWNRIDVAASDLPGWRYLPEVEVAELYRSAEVVEMFDDDGRPEAMARRLLPIAAGCTIVGAGFAGPSALPAEHDATTVAKSLTRLIRETLIRKRREFAASLPGR